MRTLLVLLALGCAPRLTAADPFEFKDGDRVVLLGSTLIEREQKYGYWELMLTLKNKDKNVTFRNLGWSGDTVFGEARNGFDESPKGFERLVSLTKELKPTVVVVCYGHNESFEGKAGAPKFTAGLEKLLDEIASTRARVVLMSPTSFINTGPLKDADAKNRNLVQYRDAMKTVAEKRRLEFVDLFGRTQSQKEAVTRFGALTDNGIHLTQHGYWALAPLLSSESKPEPLRPGIQDELVRQQLLERIVAKNQLFFHRWRPQNETYLFGFRKHEQGKNAVEVAAFDPLVARAEKEIAEMKKAIE